MQFKPHDYQRYAIVRMIKEPKLGLFLKMGLGKTVIALTAINEMLFYQHSANRVLVIAPKKVAETTWSNEASKWDHLKHLKIAKILGSKEQRIKAIESESDIYIINRENVAWLVDNYKKEWKWDTLIIDELSSFKNANTKRFKKLKSVLPKINRIYGLTGTPAANGLMDLWAQLYLLDRGDRLGKTLKVYRERFFVPDKRNAQTIFTYKPKGGAQKKIENLISDICLSFKASDLVELPEKIDVVVDVELNDKARKQYHTMERDMLLEFKDHQITAVSAGVLTGKLLQLASGAVYDEEGEACVIHHDKLDALKEIVEVASSPILVFYNYNHEKDAILKAFPKAHILKDQNDIDNWNKGKIDLLIAHPASCCYGLNIQAGGHIIVWYSPTWNLEQYEQANARLHRQGQTEPVIINHLIAKDTIDEVVLAALKGKDKVQNALLKALQEKLEEFDL